jgi:AraC-like DNA-binding protein/mannose-6-phosphate isomerase-like protein (cupin superfamily)
MKTAYVANRTKSAYAGPLSAIEALDVPVAAAATEYVHNHRIPPHYHRKAQLLFAIAGTMTVSTERGIWVVPPNRAVFVPAEMTHEVRATGRLSMRSLFIRPDAIPGLPADCCVIGVPPLLRELILHALTLPPHYPPDGPEARLMLVLLDQLRRLEVAPLHLPMPADRRLRRIAETLTADPADGRGLEEWGRSIGASSRTLARLFVAETGLSFREWRQQVRLLSALTRLARKQPVTTVALDLGYESPSAFIAMFRRALGRTPSRYFAD